MSFFVIQVHPAAVRDPSGGVRLHPDVRGHRLLPQVRHRGGVHEEAAAGDELASGAGRLNDGQ